MTATQTAHQRKRGIVDTPLAHWTDMPGFAGDLQPRDNDALRRILCDAMPETFQWLLDSGVCFYGPMPEPPHSQPRMHNVLPNSRAFIYHLERRARKAGVEIRLGARVAALDVNEAGRVCGVAVGSGEQRTHYRATGDVVLAAGDFTNDPVLKARFMGDQEAKVDGVNPTATGDGQRLAEALGAQIVNGDIALGPELRFIAPQREELRAQAAAVATARAGHAVVARARANGAVAPFRDEFFDHHAGAGTGCSTTVRAWSTDAANVLAMNALSPLGGCPINPTGGLDRDRRPHRAALPGVATLHLDGARRRLRLPG